MAFDKDSKKEEIKEVVEVKKPVKKTEPIYIKPHSLTR